METKTNKGLKIKQFLSSVKRKGSLNPLSATTLRTYEQTLWQFDSYLNSREPTVKLAQAFIIYMMKTGKKSSAARHGYALRKYFEWLGEKETLLLPTAERTPPEYLVSEELERLIKVSRTPLEKALLMFLPDTGLRIGELLKLNLSDIDFENGFIFAHREKTGMDGWIPVGKETLSCLKEYLNWKGIKDKNSRVFPYTYWELWHWLKELGELAGLGSRVHPHIFRHTAAVLRRMQGQSIDDLRDLLGHKSITSTMVYASLKSKELKEKIKPIF